MWPYEDQTKIKHLAFKDYFKVWTDILGSWTPINYFDCFGGCGKYFDKDGNVYYGSPILAAQILSSNIKLKDRFGFIIIEKEKKYIENLKKIFKDLKINFEPSFINKEFNNVITQDILEKEKKLAPTFFLIDPFGIKIKMNTLNGIMSLPKSEILLNFMYNGVVRNLNVPQTKEVLDNLYGSEDWKKCNGEEEIVDCFRKKLKENAKFVVTYRLSFPDQNRTYYYLFHISNHIKGASIMKDCFAKYNQGRVEYLGRRGNQLRLFDVKEVRLEELKKFLLQTYSEEEELYEKIVEQLIDSEPYLEREIYSAIKELEKSGEIRIQRDPPTTPKGKIRESIKNEDLIIFI